VSRTPARNVYEDTGGQCMRQADTCTEMECRHHLLNDDGKAGCGQRGKPSTRPQVVDCMCSLVVADRGEHTLDEVGSMMGFSRERARQLEARALQKLAEPLARLGYRRGDVLELLQISRTARQGNAP